MKIGVVKEEKIPADKRVPLTPKQCRILLDTYPNLEIAVKTSPIRCFTDEMYRAQGINIVDDLIATGGTAKAAAKLVERSGGKVESFIFFALKNKKYHYTFVHHEK